MYAYSKLRISQITSILNGEKLEYDSSKLVETKDALGKTNGLQHISGPDQVAILETHIQNFKSPYSDLRPIIRRIEEKLLTEHTGFLIGNQTLDFYKQDGITEMEEATMANAVERRLNDFLLDDERKGILSISRKTIYVSCVSNFTNFLDLFRKTIRSLELGIPCVILGRSNTSQHGYRWVELLIDLLKDEGVQYMGMVTFLSCSLEDIIKITQNNKQFTGNLYATCSRELAAAMMIGYPNTVASTGGPNTFVTTEWTQNIREAIRMSATIESSGQCTALRHAVVPSFSSQFNEVFETTMSIPDAQYALKNNMFDGVYAKHKGSKSPTHDQSYLYLEKADAYIKVHDNEFPRDGIDEYWRKVTVDFSKISVDWENDNAKLNELCAWLNKHQPISLAINSNRGNAFALGLALFERTGLVVYTVGTSDDPLAPPAMTCQARPQEGEIFGEFPPRSNIGRYTRYPVVIPSSTPSYDSEYNVGYLSKLSIFANIIPVSVQLLVKSVSDKAARGFCIELLNYIVNVTNENPKVGFGTSRTALWGLQCPPNMPGVKTKIRCGKYASIDAMVPVFVLFYATNARPQVELSVHPDNTAVLDFCEMHNLSSCRETCDTFAQHDQAFVLNVIHVDDKPINTFPMVANFVSLYLPMGHIKSTKSEDMEFIAKFRASGKWLQLQLD